MQKKPFLSKGKGSGGGNKRNINTEKSPLREHEDQQSSFTPQ